MMMLIPEAWAGNPLMDEERKAFYEYHAALMEPWDGPAAVAFTDGRQIGATLDRNGLRPARYLVTDDDFVIMASEAGRAGREEEKIVKKWRLQPGKMLLIDMEEAASSPTRRSRPAGHQASLSRVAGPHPDPSSKDLPDDAPRAARNVSLLDRQQAFGYTQEDTEVPAGADGDRPARKRSARWAPTRRSRRCRTSRSCSTPISSRTSRRSPTRRSTRSARSW
jgi:glutamate synthase (NADPH/NADH) large chain